MLNEMLHRLLAGIAIRLGPHNRLIQIHLRRELIRKFGMEARFLGEQIQLFKDRRSIRLPARLWPFCREVAANFHSYFAAIIQLDGVLDFSQPAVYRYTSGPEFLLTSLPEEQAAIDSYFTAVRPEAGELVFDVGANCGVSTYWLSSIVGPAGRVIAFEPDPINYAALLSNIQRHKLPNVTPVPIALGGHNGHESFNVEGSLGSGIARFVSRPTLGKTAKVECLTIETAVRRFGIPSFIKIDVEGAELEILNAAADFLSRHHCSFALDTGHLVRGRDTAARVEAIFRDIGYEAGTIRCHGYATTWARSSEHCNQS